MLIEPIESVAVLLAVKDKSDRSAIAGVIKTLPVAPRTMPCATAGRVLRLLEEGGPFQVAVIDHTLPDIDGLTLCKSLIEGKVDSRLLFLTTSGNEAAAAEALTAGVNAVVLMDKLNGYLNYLPAVVDSLLKNHPAAAGELSGNADAGGPRINILREANRSLKSLLVNRSRDKRVLEDKIGANIQRLVIPYIEKLHKTELDSRQTLYLNLVHDNLLEIVEPFLNRLTTRHPDLTATETRVAWLIREGKTTPEIARILASSKGAVNFHRNNIRKKTGLRNRKINLRTYLQTLS